MSIRYKIALLFATLVSFIISLVGIAVYLFSVKERQDTFKTRLKNRALTTAKVYADISDSNFTVLKRMDAAAVSSLYEKSISIAGYNNVHQYMYSDRPGDSIYVADDVIKEAKVKGEYFYSYKNKRAIAIHHADTNSNFIVVVAASDLDGLEYLTQLRRILLLTLVIAVILSFLAGLLFAKNLINPITRITGEVNLITSNNLSQRIKINEAGDELTRLAQTFNNLLDRLQDSFATQRRFISNASHELSTPLTSLSSQLEVAMQKERTPAEYREVMKSMYEDIREMQQLTRSLLDIAKTGSQGSIDLNEVRVDEVLLKVIADTQRQNRKFKVHLNFDVFPEDERFLTIFGNANLLYIALKNVIENGCKYSDNYEAAVSVVFDKNVIVIKIVNTGDVISEADIQNIFQPFFRTDSAQDKPGFGLGLTLTKRILSLHKGSIIVDSSFESGTLFTIELPNILLSH
jgi:signal transduction histidine kinase